MYVHLLQVYNLLNGVVWRKMPSFGEAALVRFVRSVSSSFRNQDYDFVFSEDEEEVQGEEDDRDFQDDYIEKGHAVVDIVYDWKIQSFGPNKKPQTYNSSGEEFFSSRKDSIEEPRESYESAEKEFSDSEHEEVASDFIPSDTDFLTCESRPSSPFSLELYKCNLVDIDKYKDAEDHSEQGAGGKKKRIRTEESFSVIAPTKMETKKFIPQGKDGDRIHGDSGTVGSMSSFEWRSSIYCRVSENEDPLSSSSRSCPKFESYTEFQKYDEKMSFLDRTSGQHLHETDSLRSVQVCPRSTSDRIVHRFAVLNGKSADIRHNTYHELEAAYVAQICLTWEALNWNYMNFQFKTALLRDIDPGCPAHVAQQFQNFQILLQNYMANEPYEHGRRPQIFARMRLLAPKLLVVPEYRACEDDEQEDDSQSRISSATFLLIMENAIRTFMNFLEADKENPGQVFAAYFKRNRRSLVDPSFLVLMKKVNRKKKVKLKDLLRGGKSWRRRKLKVEEEMEILMGLIDLKVVSRVLRMIDLGEGQLHWCEKKMSKVRVLHGKLQRDSSTLFFPAH